MNQSTRAKSKKKIVKKVVMYRVSGGKSKSLGKIGQFVRVNRDKVIIKFKDGTILPFSSKNVTKL